MSQGQGPGQNLQAVSQQLQELDQVQGQLQTQMQAAQALKQEIAGAIAALEQLDTGATVQVPLGGDAYVRAEIADIDEVIVDIGADYSVEQSQERAVETLEEKRNQLDADIANLRENLQEVGDNIQAVESQAEQIQQQLYQQQAQQMGGAGLGNE